MLLVEYYAVPVALIKLKIYVILILTLLILSEVSIVSTISKVQYSYVSCYNGIT